MTVRLNSTPSVLHFSTPLPSFAIFSIKEALFSIRESAIRSNADHFTIIHTSAHVPFPPPSTSSSTMSKRRKNTKPTKEKAN